VELSREGDKRKPGGVAGLAASAAAAARWSPGGMAWEVTKALDFKYTLIG